uniref:Uncharacterized protein n=1 Tax=Amphimedon queenslandica TaxID=400682 RepID=A0A1X7STU6_AMPQE
WWYKSVKYGSTSILIQTSKLYFHLLSRAKTMPVLSENELINDNDTCTGTQEC